MGFLFNRNNQEQEQEQTQQYDPAMYGGGYDDVYSGYQQDSGKKYDLIKWQQDLYDEIEMLKHDLKGEALTENGWIKKYRELINDLGVQMIEGALRPLMSRNLINSNFTEERVLLILKSTHNDIKDNLVYNYDKYNVDFLDFDLIVRLVKNASISAPFRALQGWTKKIDTSIQKRQEMFVETQQQQKRGWWKK